MQFPAQRLVQCLTTASSMDGTVTIGTSIRALIRRHLADMVRGCAWALLFIGATTAPAILAAPIYDLTILQPLPGAPTAVPRSLNNSGQVGGQSGNTPVVWNNSPIPMPYTVLNGGGFAQIFGINDTSTAVGLSETASTPLRAVRWTSPSTVEQIVPEAEHMAGGGSAALDINNAGTVVGIVEQNVFGSSHAFVWSPAGGFGSLGGFLGKFTELVAINDTGVAVGTAFIFDPRTGRDLTADQPLRWSQATGLEALALPAGRLFGAATAINDNGQIVIDAAESIDPLFISSPVILNADGSFTSLDVLSELGFSSGNSINNAGVVVGFSSTAVDPFNPEAWVATLWNEAGVFDLNDLVAPGSGYRLGRAWAINDRGEIAGIAFNAAEVPFGFLLTPIPEPGHLALLAIGWSAIGWTRRARVRRNRHHDTPMPGWA